MVKKCLIAIAVVALLATTVQAATYPAIKKDGDWPSTYIPLDLCTFPVYLEVGHYVQLYKCNELKMKLEQVTCPDGRGFPCYTDCITIKARANFPAIFGADLDKSGPNILKKTDLYWEDDRFTITGQTNDWESMKLCLDAWEVELWKSGQASGKVKVGEITISVKPPDS